MLPGKKGLIVGIANDHSIAYGCAETLRAAGAELAATYLNAKAEPYVRPLAERLQCPIIVPCDVREPGQLEAVFSRIRDEWGRLDFLLHSIAYAPAQDLHSRITDCSQAGFAHGDGCVVPFLYPDGATGGASDARMADAC